MLRKIGSMWRMIHQLPSPSSGTLTSSSHARPASWCTAMMIPPTHMMGAVTSTVNVICTSICIC